jgi:hypothetical protein
MQPALCNAGERLVPLTLDFNSISHSAATCTRLAFSGPSQTTAAEIYEADESSSAGEILYACHRLMKSRLSDRNLLSPTDRKAKWPTRGKAQQRGPLQLLTK